MLNHLEEITLENGNYSCKILANYGAALNSYTFNDLEFVNGYKTIDEVHKEQYKGVILAPFPNRTAAGKYVFKNKEYQLALNREKEGLALHGLLYNQVFEVLKQDTTEVILIHNYEGKQTGFPFPFRLEIYYKLEGNGKLSCTSLLRNTGKSDLPFGLGWHPYFKMNTIIDDLQLKFPACNEMELSEKLLPTGNELSFSPNGLDLSLKEQSFDSCFRLSNKEENKFILKSKSHQLTISAKQEDFPYFQIYTPNDRKSIAIEPMTCAPDALNNGKGLHVISAGGEQSFGFRLWADTKK